MQRWINAFLPIVELMVSVLTLIQGSAIVQMDILGSIATLVGPIYQLAFMMLLVKCIGKIKKISTETVTFLLQ